jgi:SAM-dependent methyltransferase
MATSLFRNLIRLTPLGAWRRRVAGYLRKKRAEPEVKEFKSNFWQSESGAAAFINGTDTETVPAAAAMDAVVNQFFLKHCPAQSKVLDIGSGHGIVSIFLAKHGHAVTACDISQVLLAELEKNSQGLNIQIRHGDAYHIPAKDGEFDVVVARMFLGHFPDWPDVLKEMARCCRTGGKLLVHFTSAENADFGHQFGGRYCGFVDNPDLADRVANPHNFYAAASREQLDKACAKAGLRLRERAPNTFFLHNRLIGHSLGHDSYQAYQREFSERIKDKAQQDFVIWFERTVVRHLPVWISYYNVVVLEKT